MEGEADGFLLPAPLFSLFPYSPLPHPSSPSQRPKSSLWRLFSSEASLSKNFKAIKAINGSSGDKSKDVSRLGIQQGKPSAQDKEFCALWSSTSRNLLLLVFGHLNLLFSLLLLSVTSLCYFPVTCLCWLLLIPIQLGYELLIRVVSFRFLFGNLLSTVTVHQDLHGFYKSLFRCFIGVVVLPLVSSIKLRRGKGIFGLHS
jgi:hypothetical protein